MSSAPCVAATATQTCMVECVTVTRTVNTIICNVIAVSVVGEGCVVTVYVNTIVSLVVGGAWCAHGKQNLNHRHSMMIRFNPDG